MVSEDFITIDGLKLNFDFVATPTIEPKKANVQWNHFFKRMPWKAQRQAAPSHFIPMEVTQDTIYYYTPITPFDLTADPCASWLDWHVFTLINGNDIRVLKTRDPAVDPSKQNKDLNREIGSRIQYAACPAGPSRQQFDSQIFDASYGRKRHEPSSLDFEDQPVTIKFLRQELERHTNRVRGTVRDCLRSYQYNDESNYRRVASNVNLRAQSPLPTSSTDPNLRSIPATPNGNNSSVSEEDFFAWLRARSSK